MNNTFKEILTAPEGFVNLDAAPETGAWVEITLVTGRTLVGIASYDDGAVRLVRQFPRAERDREWKFADTPHFIEPSAIVMIAFAEAGA